MSASSLADAHTEVTIERITYNWSIRGFNLLLEDVGKKIWSPWFHSRDNREKWRLELYPRGQRKRKNSSNNIDYVALHLAYDSSEKSSIRAQVEMKISKSNKVLMETLFTYKYAPQSDLGYHDFIERSKLLTTNSSDDDQFTVNCIINIPVKVTISACDSTIIDSKKSQLTDHFRLLFEDPKFNDFTMIAGDKKFATHKVILASRSPVFAAMFEHKDLEENHKKEVKIENIQPDVIRGMLEFIYTDQVTNIKALANGSLDAADKYDLEKLLAMCEKTLYEGLDKENATEVLQLADLHHADTLKKCVIKYIVNHTPEVVESNNWKKIGGNPKLLLKLFDQMALSQTAKETKSQSSAPITISLHMLSFLIVLHIFSEFNINEDSVFVDFYRADILKEYIMKYIVEHVLAMAKSNNWETAAWSHELLLEPIDQFALQQTANNEKSLNSKA